MYCNITVAFKNMGQDTRLISQLTNSYNLKSLKNTDLYWTTDSLPLKSPMLEHQVNKQHSLGKTRKLHGN